MFGPYTPLQQLDILADYGTKSYIVGSTNSLLLQQKDRYSDILINLDEDNINISSSSLRSALSLTVADRRWIDFITQSVNDTWDESNPSRPKNMGYPGSEEFIRFQFEEYLISLLSAVKYHNFILQEADNNNKILPQVDGDPSNDFGIDWVEAWIRSENYQLWNRYTDSHLFDVVEPKHPFTGSLTIEDVKARMMEHVKDFHLDERFAVGREILGRNLLAGKEKANLIFNKIYADMESLRDIQKRKIEEARLDVQRSSGISSIPLEFNAARLTAQSMGSKAGAYIGSWGIWMEQKCKSGMGRGPCAQQNLKDKDSHLIENKEEDAANKTDNSFRRATVVQDFFDADQHLSLEDSSSPKSPTHKKLDS